jgi:hypothetical protein
MIRANALPRHRGENREAGQLARANPHLINPKDQSR